jgi:cytochrome c-type biogenesis protein CcmH/NrfG
MAGLYSALFVMLLLAAVIVAMPFALHKKFFSREFFVVLLSMICLPVMLYYFSTPRAALKQWFAHGREHYELLVQFKELGGVAGTIARVKQKLAANPQDAQGWLILGKLYLAGKNYPEAKLALEQARQLAPQDEQINTYYNFAQEH